jgi:quercetin dioxygenase-like cupin family protein
VKLHQVLDEATCFSSLFSFGEGCRMESPKMTETTRKLVGHVSKLADLIDYQDGAVVSRTLIEEKVGTVTLFAFDEGQGLSEHTSPYDALVHVIEGEAEVVIGQNPIAVKMGEIIIMPAHQPHALTATTRFMMLLTMIRAAQGHP